MTKFKGFSAGKPNTIAIHTQFVSEVVPMIDDLAELKICLFSYFALMQKEGQYRYLVQDDFAQNRLEILRIYQTYQGFNLIIGQLRDIFILFFAAMSVIDGTMTLGAMLAIQYILGQLTKPTTDIMQFVQDWQDAKLSLGRISDVFKKSEKEYEPQEFTPQITYDKDFSFNNIRFTYKDVPTIKEINFSAPYGTRIALVGKSGSGKSTIIKLLLLTTSFARGVGECNIHDQADDRRACTSRTIAIA